MDEPRIGNVTFDLIEFNKGLGRSADGGSTPPMSALDLSAKEIVPLAVTRLFGTCQVTPPGSNYHPSLEMKETHSQAADRSTASAAQPHGPEHFGNQ